MARAVVMLHGQGAMAPRLSSSQKSWMAPGVKPGGARGAAQAAEPNSQSWVFPICLCPQDWNRTQTFSSLDEYCVFFLLKLDRLQLSVLNKCICLFINQIKLLKIQTNTTQ